MKQVVGGAFSGFFDPVLEDQIVQDLIEYSRFEQKVSIAHRMMKIRKGTEKITNQIEKLLGSRIWQFLNKITARIFDPTVPLEWDALSNNCQFFSDAILRYEDFGALFAHNSCSTSIEPLYLISFVVRIGSYDRAKITSKYDVPNGLTEEYLFGFRSGRHDDSDITDTLQEYWYDWGAFRSQLYKYHDQFPWDCTEAFKRNAPTCNDCTISRHVWAFPFDSWSVIQLNLQKDHRWYIPSGGPARINDKEWLENRFKLFVAQDALIRGAIAMAQSTALRHETDWLRTSLDPQYDRLKLGGIHRAQPFSHHFEPGRYKQSYLAPWASFTYDTRIAMYEEKRDERKRMADVPPEEPEPEILALPGGWIVSLAEDLSGPLALVGMLEAIKHLPGHGVLASTATFVDPSSAAGAADAINNVATAIEPIHDSIHHFANAFAGLG